MEKTFINTSHRLLRMLYKQQEQIKTEFDRVQENANTRLHKVQPQGVNHPYYLRITRQDQQYPDNEKCDETLKVKYVNQYLGKENSDEVVKIKKAHYLAKALDVVGRDIATK